MPVKNNQRRSLRSRVTSYTNQTPPPKQSHLTPLNRVIKRTNSKSSSTESFSKWQDTTLTQCGYLLPQDLEGITTPCENKPRRSTGKRISRKSFETQTLTQAGFVYYQSPTDENMVYDDEASIARNSPSPKRKRRSDELEEPITSRTRSAKKRAAAHVVKSEDEVDTKDGLKLIPGPTVRQSVATVSMPPPRTPQSNRRRVVPSSQSPADTPFSTQSQRSRDVLRSPLKAKSVNVRRRFISPGKIKSWARTGVAADSSELKDEDEEDPRTLAVSTTSIKFESVNDSQPLTSPDVSQTEDHPGARPEETTPKGEGSYPQQKGAKMKLEISDSDNDVDETDEEKFGYGSESQFDMSGPNPETISSTGAAADSATGFKVSESDETPKHATRIASQANTPTKTERELAQLFKTPVAARNAQIRATSRPWLPLNIDRQSPRHHNRHDIPAHSPQKSRVPSSISSPVDISDPLINNFSPHKSPDALPETESQLQKPWRDVSPPPTIDDTNSTPNLPMTQPSLPTYAIDVQAQQPQAPPHQPQQQQQQQKLPPVPPSQATTVDEITQQSSSSSPPRGPLLSSSSPQQPPHSPFITDHNNNNLPLPPDEIEEVEEEPDTLARDIGGWEAVRLSDSQLQIDSLIDDHLTLGDIDGIDDDDEAAMLGAARERARARARGGRGRGRPDVSLLSSSPMRYDAGDGNRGAGRGGY